MVSFARFYLSQALITLQQKLSGACDRFDPEKSDK